MSGNEKAIPVEIDCNLEAVFTKTDCTIQQRISDFLTQVLTDRSQGENPPSQGPDDWVEVNGYVEANAG